MKAYTKQISRNLSNSSEKGLASLQIKRNGELLRETTTDSLSKLREEGEPLVENKQEWPGKINWHIFNITEVRLIVFQAS